MQIPRRPLTDKERRDWLTLSRTENVGSVTFRQLIQRFGSAHTALEQLPSLAARGGKKNFILPPKDLIDRELAEANKQNVRLIASCEPDYPEALASIDDAPPILAVRGELATAHRKGIGIVGARNASLNGRKLAETLARDLGTQGYTIISGLARGIDTAAHQASLATGTVAVLAGGVDRVYPEENRKLHESILGQGGCILSDQPLGTEPQARLFPRRNRLISGLSLGVVVVEAAFQSGSLITARMALEQGREVFAVPGSPLDPRCRGTNDLIRQGAVLTESAQDILTHILHAPPRTLFAVKEPDQAHLDSNINALNNNNREEIQQVILENLSPAPVLVDELIRQCAFSAPAVLSVLLDLELAGMVERQAGNKVVLIG